MSRFALPPLSQRARVRSGQRSVSVSQPGGTVVVMTVTMTVVMTVVMVVVVTTVVMAVVVTTVVMTAVMTMVVRMRVVMTRLPPLARRVLAA